MRSNIGAGDAVFRIALGLVVFTGMFVFDGRLWWLGLFGLIPLVTGIFSWCPIYSVFGINTRRRRQIGA